MKISVSNIAWDVIEDDAVADLLAEFRVDAIDVAHSKYFANPLSAKEDEIRRVRAKWESRRISIVGMQALMYGTQGLNLFSDRENRRAMLAHLDAVCRIGNGLGARYLVFGSPRNRDRTGLEDARAHEISTAFFRDLGDIAQAHDVTICLEPNPQSYGANFMTTSREAAAVVTAVGHPAIRMQWDTGTALINSEEPESAISGCFDVVSHVHISSPQLAPVGDGDYDHASLAHAMAQHLHDKYWTIEMLATADEPHLSAIHRALAFTDRVYRKPYESRLPA